MPFSEYAKKAGPIACWLYAQLLRDVVANAINDPDDYWDEQVMEVLDRIFNYKK